MSEIISGIHPTRMELLALRKRRDIAERGRDLLREKLDALMIEFFESVRQISALRERSHGLLEEAYGLFVEASAGYSLDEEARQLAGLCNHPACSPIDQVHSDALARTRARRFLQVEEDKASNGETGKSCLAGGFMDHFHVDVVTNSMDTPEQQTYLQSQLKDASYGSSVFDRLGQDVSGRVGYPDC